MSDLSDLQDAIDEIRRWQGVPLPTEEEEQEEQKTGKWEKAFRTWIHECSKCGYRVNLSDGGIYNFCSACGAKMEVSDVYKT